MFRGLFVFLKQSDPKIKTERDALKTQAWAREAA